MFGCKKENTSNSAVNNIEFYFIFVIGNSGDGGSSAGMFYATKPLLSC